ncbi:oxidative stress-responsive serine-rich protein 1 [Scomber japonicus]|uniref:oxidative stress-responsive serine-rich protein 1 n=1 Tax=Scomber japonicus TaxID=13676 RepID=UPI00230570A8|nr:oxidative stress-responsive serine-rich protein 1 [Scomber japonicus]
MVHDKPPAAECKTKTNTKEMGVDNNLDYRSDVSVGFLGGDVSSVVAESLRFDCKQAEGGKYLIKGAGRVCSLSLASGAFRRETPFYSSGRYFYSTTRTPFTLGGWSERASSHHEAGGKDCEEETLQTAFKKLRVDAESVPGAASVPEALAPRASRASLDDTGGAKPKLSCPKDNWHGCMRKTSRGASRTQRRRRSKSPILHPPKFTYCSASSASALSPPSVCLKHQRLAVPEPAEPRPVADGRTASSAASSELSASGHISPVVFGADAAVSSPSLQEISAAAAVMSPRPDGDVRSSEENGAEKSEGGELGAGAEAADFRALSELHSGGSADGALVPCSSCAQRSRSDSPRGPEESAQQAAESPCQCRPHGLGWNGVEVYSFTGLRNVISECERSLPSHDASRTLSAAAAAASSPSSSSSSLSSGSPRSCSEQARAYVDDITIEDLSGYMEYYLYIPKKMSHMAEMMYT